MQANGEPSNLLHRLRPGPVKTSWLGNLTWRLEFLDQFKVKSELQKAAENLCYFFSGGANFWASHSADGRVLLNTLLEHCAMSLKCEW